MIAVRSFLFCCLPGSLLPAGEVVASANLGVEEERCMPVFIYVTINALITSTILPYGNKDGLSAYVIALLVLCVVTNSWQFDILQRTSYNPVIEQRLLYAIMVFVEFTICIGYARQVRRKIKSAAVYEEVVL